MRVLLFLNRQSKPVMTKEVMDALGISDWATATAILRRLEAARLVSLEEQKVGRYKSRAKFWRIQGFGTKIAAALEEAQKWSEEAANKVPQSGRVGIVDIESQGEKVAMIVQNALKFATGK